MKKLLIAAGSASEGVKSATEGLKSLFKKD